jgi:protoporphyrinogen oxidase
MTDSAWPRAAVIGAGPMGLAVAHELTKLGHRVTVLERDGRIGGMSAQIDFDGTHIERYHHFVCAPDETTWVGAASRSPMVVGLVARLL